MKQKNVKLPDDICEALEATPNQRETVEAALRAYLFPQQPAVTGSELKTLTKTYKPDEAEVERILNTGVSRAIAEKLAHRMGHGS